MYLMTVQKYISTVFLSLFFLSVSLEAENMEQLLHEYTQKNDTSLDTIDQNKGHLIFFTREKIEKMHAQTLKDILKTTPILYYHENRYAIPDPLASISPSPYSSSLIKIYVDGVEITQGWMGSGLGLYGDIDINFVDHIDFYYMAPSFEASSEPAFMTIFLYSKEVSTDAGITFDLTQGDNGYNTQSINLGEEKEDYTYMINLSHANAKRDKIDNGTSTPLSRDYERTQLFGYVKNETQVFHFQLLKKNAKSLASLSWDATPELAETDYLNLHLDYGIEFDSHWYGRLSYDYLDTDIRFKDDHYTINYGNNYPFKSFMAESIYDTYTAELTYKNTIGKHTIVTGLKERLKSLSSYKIKEQPDFHTLFDKEYISTLFFQDQYKFTNHHLLSFGLAYNHIERNHPTLPNDNLLQFRLGYIYVDSHWSYKSYLYQNMFAKNALELSLDRRTNIDTQVSFGFTQEIGYKNKNQSVSLMLLAMKDKNSVINNISAKDTEYFCSLLSYQYDFDDSNKLDFQLYYAKYKNIFALDELKDWSSYLALTNTYQEIELFNSVIWHRNSVDHENFFDVTSAITWNATQNLSLSLKGQNLLDNAKKSTIFRQDPDTYLPIEPMKIPISDRRITLEVEYTF